MKRVIAMILLAALALSLAACGAPAEADPATAIVGKWKNEIGDVMEFKADGTGTCALGASGTRSCTWKYARPATVLSSTTAPATTSPPSPKTTAAA